MLSASHSAHSTAGPEAGAMTKQSRSRSRACLSPSPLGHLEESVIQPIGAAMMSVGPSDLEKQAISKETYGNSHDSHWQRTFRGPSLRGETRSWRLTHSVRPSSQRPYTHHRGRTHVSLMIIRLHIMATLCNPQTWWITGTSRMPLESPPVP